MIHAFRQIRLTNSLLTVTGAGTLQVGSEQVVYRSQTGVFATAVNLDSTGSYLLGLINSNAGVTSINSQTGAITITGLGNLTVTNVGATIRVSGDISTLATTAQLNSTGQTLESKINIVSGNLITTGSNLQNQINILSGSGASYVLTGQTGTYHNSFYPLNSNPSGYVQSSATGNFVTTNQTGKFIDTGVHQSFTTAIATGIDNVFVSFLANFSAAPKIVASIEVTGDTLYAVNVRGRTISGYTAIFSDIISEGGVVLHTAASIY